MNSANANRIVRACASGCLAAAVIISAVLAGLLVVKCRAVPEKMERLCSSISEKNGLIAELSVKTAFLKENSEEINGELNSYLGDGVLPSGGPVDLGSEVLPDAKGSVIEKRGGRLVVKSENIRGEFFRIAQWLDDVSVKYPLMSVLLMELEISGRNELKRAPAALDAFAVFSIEGRGR